MSARTALAAVAVLALGCGPVSRDVPDYACTPDCAGRACGDDGCGGSCGTCPNGASCTVDGRCDCTPDASTGCCGADVCRFDACGKEGERIATCRDGCADATCLNCTPACADRECGLDGCGGECGTCRPGAACTDGRCVCAPDEGRVCCGQAVCRADSCGDPGEVIEACPVKCLSGACTDCAPTCAGRQCGVDGCGASCGTCSGGAQCQDGQCACVPKASSTCCGDAACWLDSCGGDGGKTPCSSGCANGTCTGCTPQCAGRACGDDGCGGSCGTCPDGKTCGDDGQCGDACGAPLPACVAACGGPDDCVPPGSPADGILRAANWICRQGTCVWKGCATDAECTATYAPGGVPAYRCVAAPCGPRQCLAACDLPADCVVSAGTTAVTDADNWRCEANLCRYAGCNTDAECREAYAALPDGSQYGCHVVGGIGACLRACDAANDCAQTTSVLLDVDNWTCTASACRWKGCNDAAECIAAYAGTTQTYTCATIAYPL